MSLRHKSVATIKDPEFINLSQDARNPGISKCEIKVFYLGQNRNGSVFTRDVAEKMAQTLPMTPIIGAWDESAGDFTDHGEKITIQNGDITYEKITVPFGFVAPDAKVWFKDFEDFDEFGNSMGVHTYMMTTGYLWTGQYPQLADVITEGKGQSMEIDVNQGHWSEDTSKGIDFYIIDDAEFRALCILGDSTEACMESASITAPSGEYTVDKFSLSLYNMLKELQFSLNDEGGLNVDENKTVEEPEPTPAPVDEQIPTPAVEPAPADDEQVPAPAEEPEPAPVDDVADQFAKVQELQASLDDITARFEENQKQYAKLEETYQATKTALDNIKKEVESLRTFKNERISADKDALIAKYHMLDDDDKRDVIENKDKYTLEEIDEKLALAYVRRNVDFATIDGRPDDSLVGVATTFNLNDNPTNEFVDPMVATLREIEL